MALIQCRVTKEIPMGGQVPKEPMSNVYVYRVDPYPDNGGRQDLLVNLVAAERQAHASVVTGFTGETRPIDETVTPPKVGPRDGLFESNQDGFASTANYWYPPWVILCQQRVAVRAWIRKYLHTYSQNTIVDADGVTIPEWDPLSTTEVDDYARDIVEFNNLTNDDGTTFDAILSTISGNDVDKDSGGGGIPLNVDLTIRTHDLDY